MELVVAIPNAPAGRMAIEHLRARGERDLGVVYRQGLIDRLEGLQSGPRMRDLPHTFHLIECADGEEPGAINRILQWHSGEGEGEGEGGLHGSVASVEPNLLFRPSATLGLPFKLGGFHATYLQDMHVHDAHNRGVKGDGITVAVVDSGAHTSMPKAVNDFYDVYANPIHPAPQIDIDGHGTAMATLIQEVAPDATVCAIRVFDQNTVNLWNLLAGAGVAAFDCKADIVSMSLGYAAMPANCPVCGASAHSRSLAFQHLLNGLTGGQAIYVASTGNSSSTTAFDYPAAYDNAVAVGSVTSRQTRSSFSNYGKTRPSPKYFFVAPGGDRNPANTVTEDVGTGDGKQCHGTSVSTAYAAGMLAVLWSDPRYVNQSADVLLRAVEQVHRLELPQGSPDPREYGFGMIRYQPPPPRAEDMVSGKDVKWGPTYRLKQRVT